MKPRRGAQRRVERPHSLPMPARVAITLAAFSLMSVAWSWPLIGNLDSIIVSGPDTWGSIWITGSAHTLGADFTVPTAGWPDGQRLLRADSLLLLLVLRVVPLATWVPPQVVNNLLVLVGPVVSALAAERFAASVLGARWPASLVAGVAYGFGGASLGALTGGQVYALVNPWIPLLAWAWWRSCQSGAPAWMGLAAGGAWAASLLTSAYVGVSATLVVVVLAVHGLVRRQWSLRAWVGAAAVAIPVATAYVAAFSAGEMRGDALTTDPAWVRDIMVVGSATLSGLVTPVQPSGTGTHTETPALGWLIWGLLGIAPLLLRSPRKWRIWAILGGLAVLLSLGPVIRLHPDFMQGLPGLLAPLANLSAGAWLRFPSRLMGVAALCAGAVAACSAQALADRQRIPVSILVGLAFVEMAWMSGALKGRSPIPSKPPSAYAALDHGSVVLDLFPATLGAQPVGYELVMVGRTCGWQATHGHTITTGCLDTQLTSDTRTRLTTALHDALLRAHDAHTALELLQTAGVTAVVLHESAHVAHDVRMLTSGLTQALGTPRSRSQDAGGPVVAWQVPAGSTRPE